MGLENSVCNPYSNGIHCKLIKQKPEGRGFVWGSSSAVQHFVTEMKKILLYTVVKVCYHWTHVMLCDYRSGHVVY